MVRLGGALLVIAGLFAAGAACADDANFAAFHRICVATGGARAAALAAAEAEGLVEPPKSISDQIAQSAIPLTNETVRARLIKDGVVWAAVGQLGGLFENHYSATDMCVLGVNPMSPESEKAAIAWGAVAPAVTDPQYQMLFFTGGEGAHRAVPKAQVDTPSAVAGGASLQLLGAGHTDGMTLMLYGVMKAVPTP